MAVFAGTQPGMRSGTPDGFSSFSMGGGFPGLPNTRPQAPYGSQFGSQFGSSFGAQFPMGQTIAVTADHYNQTPTYANGQDLTHLGYLPPPNVNTGQPVSPRYGGAGGGVYAGGSMSGGYGGGGAGDPYSIQNLINMQMQQNNSARQQNQANWESSRNYLQGIPGQYNALQSTQGAQSLTNQLSANPLSLSPQIVQLMKNQAANQISAQGDNQFNQVKRAMSADGQTDNSSMAAALEAQGRQNMGAQATQNTAIDIAAAKQRPIDLANAASVAQKQSGQDIGVPLGVGNSIIQNLPQVKPDDYSGLLALTNQMQNQQFQNQMLANQSAAASLKTPMALNPIGGQYGNGQGNMQMFGGGQTQPGSGGFVDPFTGVSPTRQNPGMGDDNNIPNQGDYINTLNQFRNGSATAYQPSGGQGGGMSYQDNSGGLSPFGDTSNY